MEQLKGVLPVTSVSMSYQARIPPNVPWIAKQATLRVIQLRFVVFANLVVTLLEVLRVVQFVLQGLSRLSLEQQRVHRAQRVSTQLVRVQRIALAVLRVILRGIH